jgi:hypothetical protein
MQPDVIEAALAPLAEALGELEGLQPLPCDGQGHPIEGAEACLHLRTSLKSPQREEALARVGPVVRKAGFVMAALIDRRDLYSLSYKPAKKGSDLGAAVEKLAALLRDPAELRSQDVVDRRGR